MSVTPERLTSEYARQVRLRVAGSLRLLEPQVGASAANPLVRALLGLLDVTENYRDAAAHEAALQAIDLEAIYGGVDSVDALVVGETDRLVVLLLGWFKTWFLWVNTVPCACGAETANTGGTRPNADELQHGARVVELHHCSACNSTTRFPRFNSPVHLLTTRRGRCGEWNNCFMLILAALGITARYVWNREDHVWCEFWLEFRGCWIHLDSCEAAYDQPHLYAMGWGKRMLYVFAIGDTDVEDVLERYVGDKGLPRKECDEEVLARAVRWARYRKWVATPELYPVLVRWNRERRGGSEGSGAVAARQSGLAEWVNSRHEGGQ